MTILHLNSLDKDPDDIARNNTTINYNAYYRRKYYIDGTIIYMYVIIYKDI